MNFTPQRVDHGYLKVLIVAQAVVAPMPGKLFGMDNSFRIRLEFNADPVPHWNAVFHIEEKLLHIVTSARQSGVPAFVPDQRRAPSGNQIETIAG
jgi:hypothetical protein